METAAAVINTGEACAILGDINRSTLKRWIDLGKVTPLRKQPGDTGGYLFDRTEIERVAAEMAAPAAEASA